MHYALFDGRLSRLSEVVLGVIPKTYGALPSTRLLTRAYAGLASLVDCCIQRYRIQSVGLPAHPQSCCRALLASEPPRGRSPAYPPSSGFLEARGFPSTGARFCPYNEVT
jgi:hypothetical protein